MFRLLFIIALFFATSIGVSAGGGSSSYMPTYSSDDGNTVYTEDGTHSGKISCDANGCTFFFDGVKKATYEYFDYPVIYLNDFYVTATDRESRRYLLKNGVTVASGETISLITGYYSTVSDTRLEGWYVVDGGKFVLYKIDGSISLEVDNAGSASSAYFVSNGVVQSTIYNRNNTTTTTYINDKKISVADGGYVQNYGIYSKSKKISELLIASSDSMGMMQLMFYNIKTGKIRNLPRYDGVTQVVPVYKKNGEIKYLEYIAAQGNKYIILNINGERVSPETYDTINTFTTYDDVYLKTFTNGEKMYLSYDGKTYGPYDYIDTFNPSYGNQNNYTKVLRWSVFVKTLGKNAILVNGKLIFID